MRENKDVANRVGGEYFPTNSRIFVRNTASRGSSGVTTARTLELNGIFERKNHTIWSMTQQNYASYMPMGRYSTLQTFLLTIPSQTLMLGSRPKNSSVVLSLICPIYEFSDVIHKSSSLRRERNGSCFLLQTYAFSLATTTNQRLFGVTTHRRKN